MNDPRVEAAAKAFRPVMGNNPYGDAMVHALVAADAADREQGIHRIKVDDATVEQVARIIETNHPFLAMSRHRKLARAVLAALTGAES